MVWFIKFAKYKQFYKHMIILKNVNHCDIMYKTFPILGNTAFMGRNSGFSSSFEDLTQGSQYHILIETNVKSKNNKNKTPPTKNKKFGGHKTQDPKSITDSFDIYSSEMNPIKVAQRW